MDYRTKRLLEIRDKYGLTAQQIADLLPDTSLITVQGWLSEGGKLGGTTKPRTINKYALALLELKIARKKPRH